MADSDFPESGDPQLIPKPLIERPTTQRMPFDSSGRLLPGGPRFPERQAAPDLKGLPWQRYPNDNWTSAEHRAVTLEFIRKFFADNRLVFVKWSVVEKLRIDKSVLLRPHLVFTLTRRVDEFEVQTATAFTDDERNDIELFKGKLALAKQCLLDHHTQNPVVERSC